MLQYKTRKPTGARALPPGPHGYSLFRLITEQIDDDEMPDRIGAIIARLARSGVPSPDRAEKRPRIKHVA
jgi:hypothetical protein